MATNRQRTEPIAFYATKEEKAQIREFANKADLSLSDYARKVLLGKMDNGYVGEEKND